jgi:1,4-dihydroxy-2-naphthoate octaprenyltransferase
MNRSTATPVEPTPATLSQPLARYLLATRPAFLTIALAGCLLGFATASPVAFAWPLALATVLLAVAAQAGVNVLNDYYDHLNGTDELNTDRLYPFTGGSRFIQNGIMGPRQMLAYGLVLFGLVTAGGIWLIGERGAGLFWIGLAGLLIGWAYSAPPLKLNSRGMGEPAVAAGFLLIVVGADFVQRGAWSATPWLVGLPYALLVTNILYINQFPDRRADIAAGKLHWVARLQPVVAARGYWVILATAVTVTAWLAVSGRVPLLALGSLIAVLPALHAARLLARHAAEPSALAPAIQLTILGAHMQPVLMAAALAWDAS